MTATAKPITARESRFANRWSEDDDAAISEMFAAGKSDDVIASALGRTIKAVELRRIRLGLRNVDRPRIVAQPIGPRPLTSGQLAEIQRHLDSGLDAAGIAALMSLPDRTVQQAIGNHHMIAMPPRNVYRPPAVRTLAPDIVPAPEPFERRRMLHPDAPISLPVVEPDRTPQVVDESKWVAVADQAATADQYQVHGFHGPEPVSLDTFNEASTATDSTPDCQADDWEPYVRERPAITGMVVVLRRGGKLALSAEAHDAIGAPEYVQLLYSRSRNSIGIRPSADAGDAKVQHDGRMRELNAVGFMRRFGVTFDGQRVSAEVVDGTLVVGVRP